MEIREHGTGTHKVAEIVSNEIIVRDASDGTDLPGNIYYQGYDLAIVHEHQLTPHFFDLSTGIAGEILQKFSNYRMKLAIVGDFGKYSGKSLRDFIGESNRLGHTCFAATLEEALERLSS